MQWKAKDLKKALSFTGYEDIRKDEAAYMCSQDVFESAVKTKFRPITVSVLWKYTGFATRAKE